jgi:hypothetical protein
MQPPKRIRLLHVLYNRLYARVKVQLATDKEVKALHELGSRIAKFYAEYKEPKSFAVLEAQYKQRNSQLKLPLCQ